MSKDDDKVGFKKPPKKHQFRKGQSGNPSGRPKVNTDLGEAFTQELDGSLTVTQANKKMTISMREALVKKLVLAAANGDVKALKLLMKHMPQAIHGPVKFVKVEKK